MWELTPRIQHYAWGDTAVIPDFLGAGRDGQPWAEAWYGAHPTAPATLEDGTGLDAAIAARPRRLLGEGIERAFGPHLPYLLKLIAPDKPLSLQVHPTREHAAESFAAENAAGLGIEDPRRNYRDDNHKPEMVLALTKFEALCGFRTPRRAQQVLTGLATVLTDRLYGLLREQPTAAGMRAAFRTLVSSTMRPSPDQVADVARASAERLAAGRSPSPRIDATVVRLHESFPGDPGVVAAMLLNPVTLQPGEAMFVPAGAIHAYQSGFAVEIMASSDNVLRAGLTPKKVDADEMLQCVSVVAAPPIRIAPESLTDRTVAYYAPVDDFELTITTLEDVPGSFQPRHVVPGSGPRILLCLEGDALVESDSGRRRLGAGHALFVPADARAVRLGGHGRIIQACVP